MASNCGRIAWELNALSEAMGALYMSQGGLCAHCGWALTNETGWHDHHLEYRMHGGIRRSVQQGFASPALPPAGARR